MGQIILDHQEKLATSYSLHFRQGLSSKLEEIHISFMVHLGHPIEHKYHFIHVMKQATQILETPVYYK